MRDYIFTASVICRWYDSICPMKFSCEDSAQAMPPALFAWADLDLHPSIYASCCSWDDKHAPMFNFFCWEGFSQTFCPDWPGTMVVSISASCIAGMTACTIMSWHWLLWRSLKLFVLISLKLWFSQSQHPKTLELQVWATMFIFNATTMNILSVCFPMKLSSSPF
jgi:hypothetical protein